MGNLLITGKRERFLNFVESVLQKTVQLSIEYSKINLCIWAMIIIALFSQYSQIRTFLSVDDIVDDHFISAQRLDRMNEDFDVGNQFQIIFQVQRSPGLLKSEVCQLNQLVRRAVFSTPEIQNFSSPFEIYQIKENNTSIQYKKLEGFDCNQVVSVAGEKNNSDILTADPLDHSPWENLFIASGAGGKKDILFEFSMKDTEGKSQFGSFDPSPIRIFVDKIKADLSKTIPEIQIRTSGSGVFQWYLLEGMRVDSTLNFLILVVFLILFRLFYGSLKGGIVLSLSLGVTGILLIGVIGASREPIDLLGNGLFLLVSIACVQDFLFVAHKMVANGNNWEAAFKEAALPAFLTSLTTFVGFAALLVSDLISIRRFGGFAAFGAVAEWAVTFLLIPSVLKLIPFLRNMTNSGKMVRHKFVDKISLFSISKRQAVGLLVVAGFAGFGFMGVETRDTPKNIFSYDHPFRDDIRYLKESRGWETVINLVLNSESESQNRELLKKIGALPSVVNIDSPFHYLDFALKSLSPSVIDIARNTLENSTSYRRYFSENGMARARVFLNQSDLETVEKLVSVETTYCPESSCWFAGSIVSYLEFSTKIVPTLLSSFMLSLMFVSFVLVVLCWLCREPKIIFVLLSSLWGAVILLGVFGLFGLTVNYVTCIFASVLVGLTGDNAIQYLCSNRIGANSRTRGISEGLSEKARASVVIALVLVAATFVFRISIFESLKTLGWLFASGILLSLVGDLWILRALKSK